MTTQDVNTFFDRHSREFGASSGNLPMTGGQGGVAYGIEGERNPHEFMTVFRVALTSVVKNGKEVPNEFTPWNKPVVIKKEALEMTLASRWRLLVVTLKLLAALPLKVGSDGNVVLVAGDDDDDYDT